MSKTQIVSGGITDGTIATADIADDAVTAAKVTGLGKIGQVVQTIKSGTETNSSTSYAAAGMNVTITPTASSSKILFFISARIGCNTSSANVYMRLRNTTASSNVTDDPLIVTRWPSDGQKSYRTQTQAITIMDSPSTTSETTYQFQIKTNSGAWTLNMPADTGGYSDNEVSTILACEVLA